VESLTENEEGVPRGEVEVFEVSQLLKIGVIGDFDRKMRSHIPTNEALSHAAEALAVPVEPSWIPTESLSDGGIREALARYDALWCAPGSPYKSMDGALRGIRFAREEGWPFIGT
jgi:CTP synthase (UTP-ammonia lyase)